jgi:hypothetical protein
MIILEVRVLCEYNRYKNIYSKNKDTEGLSFHDSKYWLNKDGLIVREERTSGLIDPKRLGELTVHTNDYDPKIKVVAPIK